MPHENNYWIAVALTMLAGLATGVGSAIAFFVKQTNFRFLSISLAFSAGVMLYVSFVEILPKGAEMMFPVMPEKQAWTLAVAAFFGGILAMAILDRLLPHAKNPHEPRALAELASIQTDTPLDKKKLLRMGLMVRGAIAIHNFPEGLVTFVTALHNPQLGVAIAIAIALHNIPEGISMSVPIYYATGNRKKAFFWSFISGFAEPVGAILGYAILRPFLSDNFLGILFAAVGGVMVFISLDELLPTAQEYGKGHDTIYAMMAGMGVMAISLVLLK